jgi:hypothetical protein
LSQILKRANYSLKVTKTMDEIGKEGMVKKREEIKRNMQGICFSYNDPSMTTSNYELWQVVCARSVLFLKNFYYVCFILELLEIQCTMIIKKNDCLQ